MKKICSITLYKEIEVEEPQISKNDKGEEIKTLVKIKKQEPHIYFLARPTRLQKQESEFYYSSIVGECVRKGIMSSNLLQKRYLNDGGVLSDEQKVQYNKLYDDFFAKQADYQKLSQKIDKTEIEKEETNKLSNELIDIMAQIQTFESQAGNALYQHTAENIARNRTAFWWMLQLSYKDLGNGKEEPVFGKGDENSKFISYDKLEELDDPFNNELLQKLLLISSLWYFGRAETQDDFDLALKLADNKDIIDTAEKIKS